MQAPASPASAAPVDRRIPELDGIRGAAILAVIVWHFVHLHTHPTPGTWWAKANMLFRVTWTGVDLFFALSGFLIGGILLSQRESPDYFRAFYLRRMCRIFPLYFAFLAVCAAFALPAVRDALPSLAWIFEPVLSLGWFATFTQNVAMAWHHRFANVALNVTWSLAIEEQFYLLLPLLIRVIPTRHLPKLLFGLIAAGIGFRLLLLALPEASPHHSAYVLLPSRWDPLFLGVLGAWAMRQPAWAARLRRAGRWLWPLFLTLGLGLLLAAVTARGVIMSPDMTLWGYSFLGLFYASGMMLIVGGHAPRAAAVLRHPILVRIGIISYAIYLLHETVNGAFHSLLLHARPRFDTPVEMAVTTLAFLTTLALAEASWRWFEKPFVEWSHRRFRYRRPEAVPVEATAATSPFSNSSK